MLWRILRAWWRGGRPNRRIAAFASLQVASLEERCTPTTVPVVEAAAIVQVASANPTEAVKPLVRTDLFCSGASSNVWNDIDEEETSGFSTSMWNLAPPSAVEVPWAELQLLDDASPMTEPLAA